MAITRRTVLERSLAATAATFVPMSGILAENADTPTRIIPSSGESITAVGLGTWITFNVGSDPVLRDACAEVMEAFFQSGGAMIDSSPMYGSAQPVVGYGLEKLDRKGDVFSADKVWTSAAEDGPAQIEQSGEYWRVPRFDLMQVHNLVAWQAHLKTLVDMKAAGEIRYVGITTSEGRRHDLFEEVMRTEPLDFVQISYNIVDREVEERILPLAQERGIAVIVNRPFQQGALTERLERYPLPDWAGEIGASSWAQIILKFVLTHPAVTVVIPATTRVDHVRENLAAAGGPMPDEAMRRRMAAHVAEL